MTRVIAAGAAALLFAACFGPSQETTESGRGLPTVSVEIPAEVAAGSVQDVTVRVSNPGPGDIGTLAVAFTLVGPVQEDGTLPTPIVGTGSSATESAVVSQSPEATAVSENGTVFVFGSDGDEPRLPEGGEMEIVFEIRMPTQEGVAANSLQVYDGSEVDRAAGVRLETTIGR